MHNKNSGIRRNENERGVFSLVKDAKALLSKIDNISDNVSSNGIRIKIIKLWPLTFDLTIKDSKK
jgi:hypothetical protein